MANAEHLIPHILKWETGITKKSTETNEEYFNRARKYGFANDPLDTGGATQSGLTLASYQAYCRKHNISKPNVANLKSIPYSTWLAIFKEDYWNRYKADLITSQSVADILVDYLWGSGCYAITKVQTALKLKADGIVGPKTISAINSKEPYAMWTLVKNIRASHYNAIVKAKPLQRKWLKGWMNRLNSLTFND